MRNLNENTITEEVNSRIADRASPRLREIVTSLTRHLHDFVREVELTEEELMQGIRFLTETGKMCDDKRQEFILLSDTLGVSMLCVALNNRKPPQATEATVFGPFHVRDSRFFELGADIANGASGTPCFVRLRIRGVDGEPVPNAVVDVWHSDVAGYYDVQTGQDEFRCRGRLRADAEGKVYFRTVKPAAYPIPDDGPVGRMLQSLGRHPWRPAHIHFLVEAGGYQTLITQIFENGDPYLDSDAVFGVRSTLIGDYLHHEAGDEYEGRVIREPFYTLDSELVLNPRRSA